MKITEFVSDLNSQQVPIASKKAANILISTAIEKPGAKSKMELHQEFVALGLKPASPVFNELWRRFADTLPLRNQKN